MNEDDQHLESAGNTVDNIEAALTRIIQKLDLMLKIIEENEDEKKKE